MRLPAEIKAIITQISRNVATGQEIEQLEDFLKNRILMEANVGEQEFDEYFEQHFVKYLLNLPASFLSLQFKDLLISLETNHSDIYKTMLLLTEINNGQSFFYASELWGHKAARVSKWEPKTAQKYRATAANYLSQALEQRHSVAIFLSQNTVPKFINDELHGLIVGQFNAEIGGLREIIDQQNKAIEALELKLIEQEQMLAPLRRRSVEELEEKSRNPTPPTRSNTGSEKAGAKGKGRSFHLYVSPAESPIYGAQKPFSDELLESSFFGGKRGRAFESSGEQGGDPSSAYKTPKLGSQKDDE